jgi:Raf kinase inhibitor-like YbhB/YbcL family protein
MEQPTTNNAVPPDEGTEKKIARRRLLQALAATGGAVAASTLLPEQWAKPVIEVGYLPAHAQVSPFCICSAAFIEGGNIPAQYTCDGADVNPPLQWVNPPAGTQSYVLIVYDTDAAFTHWILFNIPATVTSIAANSVPAGATQGRNDFGTDNYGGPCPPVPDPAHHYDFRVFALDVATITPAGPPFTLANVVAAMAGHELGNAATVGLYDR